MLEDSVSLKKALEKYQPHVGFHLAAQAGVRYSLKNPNAYCETNILGTFNLLEAIKLLNLEHFLLHLLPLCMVATNLFPTNQVDVCDKQLSFYAASKKAKEILSHTYSHVHNIPTTCFRFLQFMAPGVGRIWPYSSSPNLISEGHPIDVYNNGNMARDFTYIDDLTEALMRLIKCQPIITEGLSVLEMIAYLMSLPWSS